MIIIIDAYNMLKSMPPHDRAVTENEREQFLNQLVCYAKKKRHTIVVVFDGGPYEWPYKEQYRNLCAIYSGLHKSADDYIKEYLATQKTEDILLVSSDHELNIWAEQLDIPSIGAFHFYQLVQEACESVVHTVDSGTIVKIANNKDDAVDVLMRDASAVIPIKSDDLSGDESERTKKRRLNKRERILLKKLKKL